MHEHHLDFNYPPQVAVPQPPDQNPQGLNLETISEFIMACRPRVVLIGKVSGAIPCNYVFNYHL